MEKIQKNQSQIMLASGFTVGKTQIFILTEIFWFPDWKNCVSAVVYCKLHLVKLTVHRPVEINKIQEVAFANWVLVPTCVHRQYEPF